MWATSPTKAQKQLNMKFVCKFFLDFPIPASQANLYRYFMNLFGLLDSVNPSKTCSKLHGRLFLRSKLPTYFDDVMTIENNRQLRVNIDVTLVAILRIKSKKTKPPVETEFKPQLFYPGLSLTVSSQTNIVKAIYSL